MAPSDAPFSAEVARYLADCAEHARLLSPAHHPTEEGAVKLIWHCGADEAGQVRAAFRAAVAARLPYAIRLTAAPPAASLACEDTPGAAA